MAKSKKQSILEKYMNYVLENGHRPVSVFKFCQDISIEEKEFYKQYASFKAIEKQIFETFFTETINLLNKNKEYEGYEPREKLLSFYFTFIAMLNENRSYVVQMMEMESQPLKKLEQFKLLRKHFKSYVGEMSEDIGGIDIRNLEKLKSMTFEELSWVQFMMIIKFWLDDESPAFDKTDVFIEKSVKASFDLLNTTPINSVIDLGKFLFKEKMA